MTAEYHALDRATVEFTARQGGPLFFFVNDAVGPWPWWSFFTRNNRGAPARITVTRLTGY